jgi:hypothetical protein
VKRNLAVSFFPKLLRLSLEWNETDNSRCVGPCCAHFTSPADDDDDDDDEWGAAVGVRIDRGYQHIQRKPDLVALSKEQTPYNLSLDRKRVAAM